MESEASVPCRVWRPSVAKVRTPSAGLPSISRLAAVSAMVPPTTLVCAFNAKRSKPPTGIVFWPLQASARRSEVESADIAPSTLSVGRVLIVPSKPNFIGVPASRTFRPVRSPRKVAAKSPKVTWMSTGSSRHLTRPVAAKLFEIAGQASDMSMSEMRSEMLRTSSRIETEPPVMRISENESRRREFVSGLEGAVERGHERQPVGAAVLADHERDARIFQRHVRDLDLAGEQREEAELGGQAVGRERRRALREVAERHVGEADLAVGEERDRDVPAQQRVEPGDGADLRLDRLAHLLGRDQDRHDAEHPENRNQERGDGIAKALEAGDCGQGDFSGFSLVRTADYTGPVIDGATLGGLCDPFVARLSAARPGVLQFPEPHS